MINREELSKAKGIDSCEPARGEVIDAEAPLQALREGIIGYADLSIFEEEPLPKTHQLIEMRNTIHTPHIAAFVETAQKKCWNRS